MKYCAYAKQKHKAKGAAAYNSPSSKYKPVDVFWENMFFIGFELFKKQQAI